MRIIAGKAKGKQLCSPEGLNTRPTLDRVREAIFGSIQFDVPGSRVLDLFSGSGAMGLEASSRGASFVLLNDADSNSIQCIQENIYRTNLDCVTVIQYDYKDAVQYCAVNSLKFDFAFIDAPYYTCFAQDAATRLFQKGLIAAGGRVFLEHATDDIPLMEDGLFEIVKTKKYGKCSYSVLRAIK